MARNQPIDSPPRLRPHPRVRDGVSHGVQEAQLGVEVRLDAQRSGLEDGGGGGGGGAGVRVMRLEALLQPLAWRRCVRVMRFGRRPRRLCCSHSMSLFFAPSKSGTPVKSCSMGGAWV